MQLQQGALDNPKLRGVVRITEILQKQWQKGVAHSPALVISTEPGLNRVEEKPFLHHFFPLGSTELLDGQIPGISTKFFPGRKTTLHLEKLIRLLAREVPSVIMVPSGQLSFQPH